MPLAAGTRLGHYEILTSLGQGGMGEVYRAQDTTLQRQVALKVLPAVFLRDPDRMARFQREAQVLASLDHPNIGPIYGMVESDESRALVLALIEGPTLADRIEAGPVPHDETVAISRQIIEALEYAHDRGVVHRDLKPANVKITPDGMVKVLDFGLAKVLEDEPPKSSLSNSPTMTLGHTRAGMILGTAAYMSPEQAIGRAADRRTDIFSFGAVLYEMLTGKRAFPGTTTPDVLEAVVKFDPDWAALPEATPGYLRRLLERALVKDRKQRLQAIGEARIALEHPGVSDVDLGAGSSGLQAGEIPPPSQFQKAIPWVALASLLALAALATWTFYPRPAPRPPEAVRFTVDPPKGYTLTNNRANASEFAVSPDGRYVAFRADSADSGSASRTIWVRAMGALAAQKLDKTEGADFPFWSPDSKNIAFFADGKLKRIVVTGGSPVNICDAAAGEGGTWFQAENSNDGVILFAPTSASAIQRVPASGGVPTPVTKLAQGEIAHIFPQFLPDGKRFLYFVRGAKPGIYVQALGSEQRTFLLETPGRAIYAPPDLLLYLRDNTLLAQHWDWSALKPLGEPVAVTDEVRSGNTNGRNAFSTSSTGVLAYRSGGTVGGVYTWYTRDGKPDGLGWAEPAQYGPVALSPDNKRAIVERAQTSGGSNVDLYLVELAGGVVSRLTSDPGAHTQPVWSPDSRRVAFVKTGTDGKAAIYQMLIGSGKDTLVYSDIRVLKAWTRDGLVAEAPHGAGVSVFLIRAPEENAGQPVAEKPRVLLETSYLVDQIRVSPDGTRVAYMSLESGLAEVWVAAFPSFSDRRKVAVGVQPTWRGDGRELVFLAATGFMAAEVKPGAAFEVGLPKQLFRAASSTAGSITGHLYAMTNDGKRFLVRTAPNTSTEIEPLYLILNWPSLLAK
jgi:Tol biopolymer transport system component